MSSIVILTRKIYAYFKCDKTKIYKTIGVSLQVGMINNFETTLWLNVIVESLCTNMFFPDTITHSKQ